MTSTTQITNIHKEIRNKQKIVSFITKQIKKEIAFLTKQKEVIAKWKLIRREVIHEEQER